MVPLPHYIFFLLDWSWSRNKNDYYDYYGIRESSIGKEVTAEITAEIKKQASTTPEQEEVLKELTSYVEEVELDDPMPHSTSRRTALEKKLRSVYATGLNKLVGAK